MTDELLLPGWLGESSAAGWSIALQAAVDERLRRQTEAARYLERGGFRLVRPGASAWRLKEE